MERAKPIGPSSSMAATTELTARASEAERERWGRRIQSRRDRTTEEDTSEEISKFNADETSLLTPRTSPTVHRRVDPHQSRPEPAPHYEIEFVQQPPAETTSNTILVPPVTVQFRSSVVGYEESQRGDKSGRLWAFASLTTEDGGEVLVPPQQGLLEGNLVDSLHQTRLGAPRQAEGPTRTSMTDPSMGMEVFFVTFSDLRILEPGVYRIRVTLVSLEVDVEPGMGGVAGSSSLEQILSQQIRVSTSSLGRILGSEDL
ncbi:MAG: hypothetical protein M1833_003541 [Piccolia ochrophora]|nr:MAG: hypothetical protein M1833_003541 [Piccolia ochrophora]